MKLWFQQPPISGSSRPEADLERYVNKTRNEDENFIVELHDWGSQPKFGGKAHSPDRPLKLAVGMTDSPVRLVMWIYDATVRIVVDQDIWTLERLVTLTMMR